jgi:putative aldouronate transport system substrate-binding protein
MEGFMKKLIAFVLVVLMASSIFAAGEKQQEGGIVTLTHFVDIDWMDGAVRYLYNIDGRIPQIVEQKTGVRLDTTFAKNSEEANLMIASGDVPDMITLGYEGAAYNVIADSKMVIDFLPVAKEKFPDFYNYMGEGFWNFYKSPGGRNNYFPNWAFYPNSGKKYSAIGVWNQALIQRTDIFTALGKPDISTPEKFLAHLREVKAKYPNIKPFLSRSSSSLPLGNNAGSGLDGFKVMFGIEGYYELPDHTIKGSYMDPRYRDLIIFLNRMYREGFLTRDDLAGTNENFLSNYDKGDFYMTVHGVAEIRYPPKAKPDLPYQTAQPFDTAIGCQQGGIAGFATFISSKCKYPEKALGLIAYLAQEEGDRLSQWGEEGKDWEWDNLGQPVYTKWYLEQTEKSSTDYFREKGMYIWSMNWADHDWVALNVPGELPYMRQLRDQLQDHWYAKLNFLSLNPSGNIPEAITYQKLTDYWTQEIPQIIMAASENEALAKFEAMKVQLDSLGIASVEKYWTMRSNRIREAFGDDNLILWGADNAVYHRLTGTPAPKR